MSKARRWILVVVSGLAVLLVVLAFALPRLLDVNSYRPRIEELARKRLGRGVELGTLGASLFPFPAVTVAGAKVDGPPGAPPLLETGVVRIGASLVPLLSGRLVVTGIVVEDARIQVKRDAQGRWDFLELLKASESGPGSSPLVVKSVRLDGARIRVEDEFIEPGRVVRHELAGLDAEISGLDEPAKGFALRVDTSVPSAGGARIQYSGRVGPGRTLDGEGSIAALDLARVAPYLAPLTGLRDVSGRLDVEADVERVASGRAAAKGRVAVADLAWPLALKGTPPLSAGLDFDVRVEDSGKVNVKQARLKSGKTTLDIAGDVTPEDGRQVVAVRLAETLLVPQDIALLLASVGLALPRDALGSGPVRAQGSARIVRERQGPAGAFRVTSIAADGVRISGARLDLRRTRDGSFALPGMGQDARTGAKAGPAPSIVVRDLAVRDTAVRIVDESLGAAPVVTSLTGLELSVGSYAPGRPAEFSAQAQVAGGSLNATGTLTPGAGGSLSVDVRVGLSAVEVDALRPYLGEHLALSGGTATLDTRVTGNLKTAFAVEGTLGLRHATVGAGGRQAGPLDLDLGHDIAFEQGGQRITLRRLDVGLPGARLQLDGRIELRDDAPAQFDIGTREAVQLAGKDLVMLSALASGRMPFDLTAEDPLELGLRLKQVNGRLTAEGRVRVSRATLRHRLLLEPLQVGRAEITLSGETLTVRDATLRLGRSDLTGTLSLEGFERHRVTFDLAAREADLDQLFAFLGAARAEDAGREQPADTPDHLALTTASGRLRVERATLGGLELSAFTADVLLRDRVLTLDPVGLNLYGGSSAGRITVGLGQTVPTFTVSDELRDVAVRDLLAAGIGYEQLTGTGSASFTLEGSGGGVAAALGTVQGGGNFALESGTFKGLNVLAVLKKAEVFGETSIAALGQRLAAEGTAFNTLTGEQRVARGVLTLANVRLDAPDAAVAVAGTIGLLDQRLDLGGQVLFSKELSEQMRAEGSRAARAFWDDAKGRVLLPVRFVGTIAKPSASIDWEEAMGRAARREATRELDKRTGGLLGSLFGGASKDSGAQGGGTPAPAGGGTGSAPAPPDAGPSQLVGGTQAAANGLTARIDSARFSGSFLAPDLKLKATLAGPDLSHGVVVVKSGGRTLVRRDLLWRSEIEAAAGAGPVEVALTISGKDVLGAKDVVVEVTPVDRSGTSGPTATAQVASKSLF